MKCYHCGSELSWDSDIDLDHDIYSMLTFLTCTKCQTDIEVYKRREEEII